MGEAKKRGTKEQRADSAVKRQKVSIDFVKAELGLPESSAFMGYVIYNEFNDDYLASTSDKPTHRANTYVKNPESALRFQDYRQAISTSNAIMKTTKLGLLFDTGDQYIVAFDS